jgi:hypothetical protein
MSFLTYLRANRALGLALAWVLAGCSTNAGFGTPVSGPNPVGNPYQPNSQPYGTSPMPTLSGSISPYMLRPAVSPAPSPTGSPTPTPSPIPNTLTIVGPALRLAFDGSAKDPVKAPRVLELSFALQNTTQNGAKITSISAYADKTALGSSQVTVSAAAGATSEVAALVLKTSDDPSKYKDIMLNFLDDSKKMIGSVDLDVPPMDTQFTSLDEKHPKGPFSIDSLEISELAAPKGPHYDCTFAVTNASATAVSVAEFDIQPPKGDVVKVAVPLPVPARAVSDFISVVVPYGGKSLPSGTYTVTATQNGAAVARSTAVLL